MSAFEALALCVDTVSRAGGGGADADATLSDCATATALRGGDAQASTAVTMFASERNWRCAWTPSLARAAAERTQTLRSPTVLPQRLCTRATRRQAQQ